MKKKTVQALSLSLSVAMALTGVPAAAVSAAEPSAVIQTAAQQKPWAENTTYATGDVVSHNNQLYQCRQGHTSLRGWEPNVVLALWLPIEGAPDPSPIIAVTGVSITPKSLQMEVGAQAALEAAVTPSDATDKTLTWKSKNPAVVTVKDGIITAVAPGTAEIIVTAGGKTAKCRITAKWRC